MNDWSGYWESSTSPKYNNGTIDIKLSNIDMANEYRTSCQINYLGIYNKNVIVLSEALVKLEENVNDYDTEDKTKCYIIFKKEEFIKFYVTSITENTIKGVYIFYSMDDNGIFRLDRETAKINNSE